MSFPPCITEYKWVSKVQKPPHMWTYFSSFSLLPFHFFFPNEEAINVREEGKKIKNIEQILNVILIHSKRKRNIERVVVKKNPKPFSPTLARFARRLQLETLARLYSKLCGFHIYLSKEYLLYLLCKPCVICTMLGAWSGCRKGKPISDKSDT